MSTGPNRLFDEFAKVMTDAAGAAQGVRQEFETAAKAQMERIREICAPDLAIYEHALAAAPVRV